MKFDTLVEQLAKDMSIKDIADTHKKDVSEIETELEKGAETEKEHTGSDKEAKEIAKDHLVEDPKYYTKIKKAGL